MRRLFAITLGVIVFAGAPLESRADDAAAALLAKHKAFAGWQFGDGAFKSMKLSGTVGGYLEYTRFQRGSQFHTIRKRVSTELSQDVGFTGTLYWSTNSNGFTVPLIGEAGKFQVVFNYLFNEGFTALAGTTRGSGKVGDVATSIVRVNPQNGYPVDLYIEPVQGALKRIVIDPDVQNIAVDILRYDLVDSTHRIIASWGFEGATPVDIKSIKVNVAVSDDDLRPPAQRSQWTFGSPDPIPLTVSNGWDIGKGGVQFDALVNGVRGHFIFDTGAGGIYLTTDFATRAHVRAIAPGVTYGANDLPIAGSISSVDTIQIGASTLHNVNVFAGRSFGTIDGLLGFDFLAGAIVDVDLKAQQMRIYNPATTQANTTDGFTIIADLSSGHIRVPVRVNGSTNAIVALDSGDPALVFLSETLYKNHKVDMKLEGHTYLGGIGGVSRNYIASCGHLHDLSLGPITYDYVPVCFQPSDNPLDMGLVGFDFMKHFNWTFDYQHSQVVLTKNGL